MKKLWRKFRVFQKEIREKLEKVGISKKESAAILAAIYNPITIHIFILPTCIAAVYVMGRIIYIKIKYK